MFKVDENFGISRIEIFIFSGTGRINIYFNNKWGFSSIGKRCVQKISQNSKKKKFLKRKFYFKFEKFRRTITL